MAQFTLPNTVNNKAPSYNLNDPTSTAFLQMGLSAMGAGRRLQGLAAFMPESWGYQTPLPNSVDASGDTGVLDALNNNAMATSQLAQMANGLGLDLSKYNLNGYIPTSGKKALDIYKNQGSILNGGTSNFSSSNYRGQSSGLGELFLDANNELKDYMKLRTASAGWDNKNDPRSMTEAIYKQTSPNVWQPVTDPKQWSNPEKGSWAQTDGAELLSALSMVMPAFGGWAGLLGNGVQGTLTAGGGLGLTSGLGSVIGNGLANTLVNTGVQSALGGGVNPTNLLAGLGMSAAGSIASGQGLGNMFNTNVPTGPAAAPTSLGSLWNSGIGSAIRNTPFFRTEYGGLANQGLGALARLFK